MKYFRVLVLIFGLLSVSPAWGGDITPVREGVIGKGEKEGGRVGSLGSVAQREIPRFRFAREEDSKYIRLDRSDILISFVVHGI